MSDYMVVISVAGLGIAVVILWSVFMHDVCLLSKRLDRHEEIFNTHLLLKEWVNNPGSGKSFKDVILEGCNENVIVEPKYIRNWIRFYLLRNAIPEFCSVWEIESIGELCAALKDKENKQFVLDGIGANIYYGCCEYYSTKGIITKAPVKDFCLEYKHQMPWKWKK